MRTSRRLERRAARRLATTTTTTTTTTTARFARAMCAEAATRATTARRSCVARRSNPNRDRRRAIERADVRANATDADAANGTTRSRAIVEAQTTHPVKTQSVEYSFARSGFASECERALNAQINVEYNVSYIYHAMWAYFSRDNVALKGFAEHFKREALEERAHAEQLMEYMNLRGGRVELQQLLPPQSEYDHPEKGCALYALELSLSLEKLNNDKLCELHRVADDAGDAHMCDFLEGEMLAPQVESVREVSEMVATLLRMGPPGDGMAAWHFDQTLRA